MISRMQMNEQFVDIKYRSMSREITTMISCLSLQRRFNEQAQYFPYKLDPGRVFIMQIAFHFL